MIDKDIAEALVAADNIFALVEGHFSTEFFALPLQHSDNFFGGHWTDLPINEIIKIYTSLPFPLLYTPIFYYIKILNKHPFSILLGSLAPFLRRADSPCSPFKAI